MARTAVNAPLVILFVLLGAGAGAVHFVAIARDVELLTHGGSALAASGWRLGRVLMTVAVLAAAAHQGWPVLLGATVGFMVARHIVLRRIGGMS
jgi:F1F0 ATPase subunit 2